MSRAMLGEVALSMLSFSAANGSIAAPLAAPQARCFFK
jgi:hypothetical protein